MAVYYGGKKVKELYYGGKKIKEAWYGGKKVYSSGPSEWRDGARYKVGDLVTVGDRVFQCKYEHAAFAVQDKPGEGRSWSVYWRFVGLV